MRSRLVRFVSPVSRGALALGVVALGVAVAGSRLMAAGPVRDISLRVSFSPGGTIINDSYGQYVDQIQNVLAVLYPSGSQGFNTQADERQPATRAVCFGAGTPVDDAPAFPAVGCAAALVVMGGNASNVMQNMTAGQSVEKLVRFNWTIGAYRYRLGFGTDMNTDDLPDAPMAVVTCTVFAGGHCTTWTLQPQAVAALYRAELSVGKGGKIVEGPNTYVGHYLMPFAETMTLK